MLYYTHGGQKYEEADYTVNQMINKLADSIINSKQN